MSKKQERLWRPYRGVDSPEAKRARELKERLMGHQLKLVEYQRPQKRGGRKSTRTHRQARWVRA
jgi:hypothetical protein